MITTSFARNILTCLQKAASRYLKSPYKKVNINWFLLKVLKHLPAGKLRHHTLDGKKVFYRNPQEFLHGLEEIFIDEVYLQKLPFNAYVIDCGSNIGLSIIYIKQLWKIKTKTYID